MNKHHIHHFFTLVCILSIFTGACTNGAPIKNSNRDDAAFFMGLRSVKQEEYGKATRYFNKSIKKASPLIARRAQEELCKIGSIEERIKKCTTLYNKYNDEDSLVLLCKELHSDKQFTKIIQLTEEINLKTCNNMLAYYRLFSLYDKKASNFVKEYYEWFMSRQIEAEHYKLFCDVEKSPDVFTFRVLVYMRNYGAAFTYVENILKDKRNHNFQILSDAGKTLLYGSKNYTENAQYMSSFEQKLKDENLFLVHFYTARLYDKAEKKEILAEPYFLKALEEAKTGEQYDNALWYYFNNLKKNSLQQTVKKLELYKDKWNSPTYFDDFFDTFSNALIASSLWQEYYDTTRIIKNFASGETVAKYCYVTARLLEEGLINTNKETVTEEAKSLYNIAFLRSSTDLYYKVLAAKKLNLTKEELKQNLSLIRKDESFTQNQDAEKLLAGYADFGFPEFIYDDWQKYGKNISLECTEKIATFLQGFEESEEEYFVQGTRIASKKAYLSEKNIDQKILSLAFPKGFSDSVKKYSELYNESEYLLYALIRSESFFAPKVVSSAGAIGLTQLMALTADDIAKKLKLATYDLQNPDTNIMFGSYYLGELIKRLDGSQIKAVFSYNGGISRVRTWAKTAETCFKIKEVPADLFLEFLPFTETREYGRKIVSASAMYGLLYYNLDPVSIAKEIME